MMWEISHGIGSRARRLSDVWGARHRHEEHPNAAIRAQCAMTATWSSWIGTVLALFVNLDHLTGLQRASRWRLPQ